MSPSDNNSPNQASACWWCISLLLVPVTFSRRPRRVWSLMQCGLAAMMPKRSTAPVWATNTQRLRCRLVQGWAIEDKYYHKYKHFIKKNIKKKTVKVGDECLSEFLSLCWCVCPCWFEMAKWWTGCTDVALSRAFILFRVLYKRLSFTDSHPNGRLLPAPFRVQCLAKGHNSRLWCSVIWTANLLLIGQPALPS